MDTCSHHLMVAGRIGLCACTGMGSRLFRRDELSYNQENRPTTVDSSFLAPARRVAWTPRLLAATRGGSGIRLVARLDSCVATCSPDRVRLVRHTSLFFSRSDTSLPAGFTTKNVIPGWAPGPCVAPRTIRVADSWPPREGAYSLSRRRNDLLPLSLRRAFPAPPARVAPPPFAPLRGALCQANA